MDTNTKVYVVAYREVGETESDSEAWREGNFEAYNYYPTKAEANKIASELRDDLKSQNRRDMKVFIRPAYQKWCEVMLG